MPHFGAASPPAVYGSKADDDKRARMMLALAISACTLSPRARQQAHARSKSARAVAPALPPRSQGERRFAAECLISRADDMMPGAGRDMTSAANTASAC